MRRGRSRRYSRTTGQGKAEYLWVTGQVDQAAAAAVTTVNNILVQGADWERGGADARETCTLVRVIADISWSHAGGNALVYPMLYVLMVQDEDEGAVSPAGLAVNGDERFLSFGTVPFTSSSHDGTTFLDTGHQRLDVKQRVRLGNNNEVRLLVRNQSAGEDRLYSLQTRCLLRLSR